MSEIKKLKVATVIGTRPEIIRLSRVMTKLDEFCEHSIIHTGQNYDYELNQIFFDDLKIRKPDYFLNAAGKSGAETIGKIIIAVDDVLAKINPEALLVLGDTNSCLSVIPAKRRRIPIFHMEAGNRCFDQRVPEEINRRIVDHTADINLTYSDIAREYLLREGISPETVIKTGSPMFEVLNHYRANFENSDALTRMALKPGKYFVISTHREENIDAPVNFNKIISILNTLAEQYDMPLIVSTHPRTRQKIEAMQISLHAQVRLLKPLGFFDYLKLQTEAAAVISDSGTINEESSILNFPALNLREAHERPEGMEEGSVMMVGVELERILQAMPILLQQQRGKERLLRQVSDYSMPNVSDKIIRIIHSYNGFCETDRLEDSVLRSLENRGASDADSFGDTIFLA
jgi:UDP-N-acetylglucosamine 2-epimerase (non-hydrolysing)